MNEVNFGELSGYNGVMEYCTKMLEIIKHLRPDNINFQEMQEIAGYRYEYASARVHCAIQTLKYFQLHEKYGNSIDISAINVSKLTELLKNLKIEQNEEMDIVEKDSIFRNCLAHGRYTLSMNEDGHIDVIFRDKGISGKISYSDFRNLTAIYINSFNIDGLSIVENPFFEVHSVKKLSKKGFYQAFFKNILKKETRYERNFDAANEFENAIKEYAENPDSNEKFTKFVYNAKRFLEKDNKVLEQKETPLNEEEQDFFTKYMECMGRKNFTRLFSQQIIRLGHIQNIKNILLKKPERFYEISLMKKESVDYYNILTQILNTKNGQLLVSTDQQNDLIDFISTIDHMDELGSQERSITKEFEDYMDITMGRLTGIDTYKLPLPTRDEVLRKSIQKLAYLSPILYSNMLLTTTNYSIGYVKEVNSNYDKGFFEFKDIDLKGCIATFDDPQKPSVIEVDPHQKVVNELNKKIREKRDPLVRKIRNNINFTNKKGKNSFDTIKELLAREGIPVSDELLKENEKIKQELQEIFNQINHIGNEEEDVKLLLKTDDSSIKAKLQKHIEFLQNNEKLKASNIAYKNICRIIERLSEAITNIEELRNIEQQIISLKQKVLDTDGQPHYQDSSRFFDHIRNAIIHSYFNIDYEEFFSSKDFSKIRFYLEDYEKDKNSGNTRKTFEIELSAEQLMYLIRTLQSRLEISMKSRPDLNLENIYLDDLRDARGIQRYDYTKYDSASYPIKPKKVSGSRPTNREFEEAVGDGVLIQGMSSNALDELQNSNDRGEKK